MHSIDLKAYLGRIAYTGPLEPTLETLRGLHLAHSVAFVFENLDNWSGKRVSLDLAEIEKKLIHSGRGGYCFECNTLFAAVLRQLGFEVTALIGWVVWMQPPGSLPTRTHMILKLTIDGRPWIADVGFGGLGQTGPLAMDTTEPQQTPHDFRRYRFDGEIITQQVKLGEDQWEDLYRFDLRETFPMDFEIANWFVATNPGSLFRKTLLATLIREDGRITIAFGEFIRRAPDGTAIKRPIADDDDLRELLVGEFGLPAGDPAVGEATLIPGA